MATWNGKIALVASRKVGFYANGDKEGFLKERQSLHRIAVWILR